MVLEVSSDSAARDGMSDSGSDLGSFYSVMTTPRMAARKKRRSLLPSAPHPVVGRGLLSIKLGLLPADLHRPSSLLQ